jgi:hypothetical protein
VAEREYVQKITSSSIPMSFRTSPEPVASTSSRVVEVAHGEAPGEPAGVSTRCRVVAVAVLTLLTREQVVPEPLSYPVIETRERVAVPVLRTAD